MPAVKYSEIQLEDVNMDGVKNVVKANVIGAGQGWKENAMRVFRIGPEGQRAPDNRRPGVRVVRTRFRLCTAEHEAPVPESIRRGL